MIAAIATAFIFLLLQVFVQHKPKPVANYDKLIALNEWKYKSLEIFSLIPLFFFIGSIAYIFYLLGNDIQGFITKSDNSDYSIFPEPNFWLMIGMFFGFGLIITPMEVLYRMVLREEYPAYIEYTNRKHGYNGLKVLRPLCIILVVAGVILSFLGLNWSVKMRDNTITFNDFFQLQPQTYKAEDVLAIHHFSQIKNKEGVLEQRPHYKVLFSDGREWNTDKNMIGGSYETYTAMVKHLSIKSGNKISYQNLETL
ncbi:hypothetical protein [Pontibacter sp. H249]|uniref:hypothetical protein n=1 Tax=Pontibacter sp. H249 TaxID=3133420 RepID=UPI0030C0648D